MALCPGLPGWAGTRNIKPIWILLKQVTVSGSGISWAICKSATRSRQITTSAPHHSVFYRPDALPAAQPTVSEHWRQSTVNTQHTAYISTVTNGKRNPTLNRNDLREDPTTHGSEPLNQIRDHWTSVLPVHGSRQSLENTGVQLWAWLRSRRVCHEEREL